MKKRIAYISLYFFTVLLIFILQKPLFMLYNGSIEKGFGFADYMQVMVHGASLDAATAGYLTAFPFLLVLISIWFRKFPLKKILYGYYILAAALISIIFVVDMALYTFWGFKLDASVFLYIDSPKEALASVSVGFTHRRQQTEIGIDRRMIQERFVAEIYLPYIRSGFRYTTTYNDEKHTS